MVVVMAGLKGLCTNWNCSSQYHRKAGHQPVMAEAGHRCLTLWAGQSVWYVVLVNEVLLVSLRIIQINLQFRDTVRFSFVFLLVQQMEQSVYSWGLGGEGDFIHHSLTDK